MPYTKTNWVDKTPTNSGTPVNADNLNKIEQGIEDVTLQTEQHITNSDIHATPEDKIEWNKISEVYKGEIYSYQRDDAKESGLYKVNRALTPGLLSSWLLVSAQTDNNGVFIGGEQLFLSATYTVSGSQLQQRRWNKSTNAWGAWENYTYQSDLLPILQDIVELQEEKLSKAEAPNLFANAIIGTASGETVTLTDVQEGTSARSLKILGETTEIGEGEKSPDNPYELVGVENPVVTVHGKNLWQNDGNLPKTTGGVTVSYDSESGEYILHGTSSSATLNIYIMPTSSPVLTFRKDTQVTLKITRVSGTNSGSIRAIIAKSDFTGGVGAILSSSGGTAQNTATVTAGTQINRMYFYIDATGTVLNNLRLKVQLEIDSTPTAFEPFKGYDEYPITKPPLYSLPDGTRDYIEVNHNNKTATLKQNVGVVELDGTENWSTFIDQNETHWRTIYIPTPTKRSNVVYNSTHFEASNPVLPTTYIYIGSTVSGITMHLLKTDFPNMNSWTSWLANQQANGTPVKILYKIDETESNLPYFDIPLYSPTTIISTDQGSLEVEYNRDINSALTEGGLDPADFVPRVNTANRVYTTSATGQQETKPISEFATPSYVDGKIDVVQSNVDVLQSDLDTKLDSVGNIFYIGDYRLFGGAYINLIDGEYIYNPNKPGDYYMYCNGNSVFIKEPFSNNVVDYGTGKSYVLSVYNGEVSLKEVI